MTTQKTSDQVPDGYWRNAQGNLVPDHKVKAIDKERDKLVKKIVAQAKALQASMAAFKSGAMGDIETFINRSSEHYGATRRGKKGNITLPSFDGQHRIQVAVSDRLVFDERIHAAKTLIDEFVLEETIGSTDNIKALIEHAFQVNKEGRIDMNRVLGLRALDITAEKWVKAMEAISDAVQVVGSATYLRIYERVGDSDRYQQISLDIAGL